MRILLVGFLLVIATWVNAQTYLFVGTYTGGKPDKGIYIYEFDAVSGDLEFKCSGANLTNPSYLSLSADGKLIYACVESKLPGKGSVATFSFNSAKPSVEQKDKELAGGENPVYVAVDRSGKYVINANYTEGTVSVFRTEANGVSKLVQLIKLEGHGLLADRQDKAHPHAIVFSPDQAYVFIPDLGSDKIRGFGFDVGSDKPLNHIPELDVISTPGSGPRHMVFHPNQLFAYCVEELSGTVSAYAYSNGVLTSTQRVFSYTKKYDQYSSADIHISADGRFLYVSNRLGENNIAIFSIDENSGTLTLLGHQDTFGETPRSFCIDPSGNFLLVANQTTNNISIFKRDKQTGLLSHIRKDVNVPGPSCLKMKTYP